MLTGLGGLLVPIGVGEEAVNAPSALQKIGQGVTHVAKDAVHVVTPKTPQQKRKETLIGAGVVGAGVVAYAVYRHFQTGGTAIQTAVQPATGLDTGGGGAAGSGSVPTLPLSPPGMPMQPNVSSVTDTTVSLVISPAAGAGQYAILDAVTGAVLAGSIVDPTQPVTITGLTPGTAYAFSEQAINQNGASPPSAAVNVTTTATGEGSGGVGGSTGPEMPPQCPAGFEAQYIPGQGWACVLPPMATPQNPISYVAGKGFDFPPPPGTYPVINPTTGLQTGTVTVGGGGVVTGTTGTGGPPKGSTAAVTQPATPKPSPATTTKQAVASGMTYQVGTGLTGTNGQPIRTADIQLASAPIAIRNRAGRIIGTITPTHLGGFGTAVGTIQFNPNSGLTASQMAGLAQDIVGLPAGSVGLKNGAGRTVGVIQKAGPTALGSSSSVSPAGADLLDAAQNQNLTDAQRLELLQAGGTALSAAQRRALANTNQPITQKVAQGIIAGHATVVTASAASATGGAQRSAAATNQAAQQAAAQAAAQAQQATRDAAAKQAAAQAALAAAQQKQNAAAQAAAAKAASQAAQALAAQQAAQVRAQERAAAAQAAQALAQQRANEAAQRAAAQAAANAAAQQAAQQQAAQALAQQEAIRAQQAAQAQAAAQQAQNARAAQAAQAAQAAAAAARAAAQAQERQNVLAQGPVNVGTFRQPPPPQTHRQPATATRHAATHPKITRTGRNTAVVQGTGLRLVG